MKAALVEIVPEDQTITFTLTAPFKVTAKTRAKIEMLLFAGRAHPQKNWVTQGVCGGKQGVGEVAGV